MKVAVVGCGGISVLHLKALEENTETSIVAVCDTKKERADKAANEHCARAYYDYDKMLENEELDSVHICTPHYLHTPMALKALKKGINVLIEKPCSVSLDEINQLNEAQIKSGKTVGVCFQNRYNECVGKAKEIIDSGELGKLLCVCGTVIWCRDADYYDDDWHGTLEKECGGVLINQSIHTIDLIQYLCGKCKSLVAHVSNDHLQGVIEVEDNASIVMTLENGVKSVFYATTAYGVNSPVFIEIVFENGKLRLEGTTLTKIDNDITATQLIKKSNEVFYGKSYWGLGHSMLISDFYDCIKNNRSFFVDNFEASEATKIVLNSYLSSKENKRIDF